MKNYYLDDGSKVTVDPNNPLGKGGEGTVYTLHKEDNILLKVYSKRALNRMPEIKEKVSEMVKKRPSLLTYQGLTIIAWPAKAVYDTGKNFVGYLMHRVNAKNNLSHVITPGLQKRKFPDITWLDRLVVAINLALVMDQIHKNDAVIGDINTSDFFVYPGLEIGVVDTDSFQFKSEKGKLFHCNVFTPDYTPPEIIRAEKSKKRLERTPNNDNYGLAILIFQILMNGVHPFSARISKTLGFDGNAINYCMENEIFPYRTKNPNIKPPKNAMPLLFLPNTIQLMFEKAFKPYQEGEERPTSDAWVKALREVKDNLKHCKKKKTHYFPNTFKKCPLCEREKTKDYDHLLNKYSHRKTQYLVVKDSKNKSVFIKEDKSVFKTLSGRFLATSKRNYLALLFSKNMLKTHAVEKRIDTLLQDKTSQNMNKYTLKPIEKLYNGNEFIGVLVKHKAVLYPVDQFIKASRLGKQSITEKTKIEIAEQVTKLFQTLEKEHILIEYEYLYVDKFHHIYLPDYVLLSFENTEIPHIALHADDYYPQEYYLYHQYLAHQKQIKKQLKNEEESKPTDNETVNSPIDNNEEIQTAKTFSFEESTRHLGITNPSEGETVPEITSYDNRSTQSIRFRLAIIIHRIIANVHPFDGHYNQTKKESSFFIKNNLYLHKDNDNMKDIKSSSRVIDEFPNTIQHLFEQALYIKNPEAIKRPSPKKWQKTLKQFKTKIRRCKDESRHYFYKKFYSCPLCYRKNDTSLDDIRLFCKREKKTLLDYFIASNLFVNKLILASIILFLIYSINAGTTGNVALEFEQINLQNKQEELLTIIRFETLKEYTQTLIGWIQNVWKTIVG